MKLLLRGRWPPIEGPTPIPRPPVEATPGASREAFSTPSPIEALGRVESSSLLNVWERFWVVVSRTTSEFAFTSTVLAC